jgi:hypothetical protein
VVWELLILVDKNKISLLQHKFIIACGIGLAAPAIAQGMGALAPTFGSIVPAIGASGFAAAASATGSVAGSAAVAASFGGMEKWLVSKIL